MESLLLAWRKLLSKPYNFELIFNGDHVYSFLLSTTVTDITHLQNMQVQDIVSINNATFKYLKHFIVSICIFYDQNGQLIIFSIILWSFLNQVFPNAKMRSNIVNNENRDVEDDIFSHNRSRVLFHHLINWSTPWWYPWGLLCLVCVMSIHWGRVRHICVSNPTTIGSDDGFREILIAYIRIQENAFENASGKWSLSLCVKCLVMPGHSLIGGLQ